MFLARKCSESLNMYTPRKFQGELVCVILYKAVNIREVGYEKHVSKKENNTIIL